MIGVQPADGREDDSTQSRHDIPPSDYDTVHEYACASWSISVAYTTGQGWLQLSSKCARAAMGVAFLVIWLIDTDRLNDQSSDYGAVRGFWAAFAILLFFEYALLGGFKGVAKCVGWWHVFGCVLTCLLVAFLVGNDQLLWNKSEHRWTCTHSAIAALCVGSFSVYVYTWSKVIDHLETLFKANPELCGFFVQSIARFSDSTNKRVGWLGLQLLAMLIKNFVYFVLLFFLFMVYDVVDHRDPSSYPTASLFWSVVGPMLLLLVVLEVAHMTPAVSLFFSFPANVPWTDPSRKKWLYLTAYSALWLVVFVCGAVLLMSSLWHYQRDIQSHVKGCNTCGAPALLRYGDVGDVSGTSSEVVHGLCRSACPADPSVYDYTQVDVGATMCREIKSYECCSEATAIYSLGEHCEMRMAVIRVALIYLLGYCGGAAIIEAITLFGEMPAPEPLQPVDSGAPVDIAPVVAIDESTGLLEIEDHNTTGCGADGP